MVDNLARDYECFNEKRIRFLHGNQLFHSIQRQNNVCIFWSNAVVTMKERQVNFKVRVKTIYRQENYEYNRDSSNKADFVVT